MGICGGVVLIHLALPEANSIICGVSWTDACIQTCDTPILGDCACEMCDRVRVDPARLLFLSTTISLPSLIPYGPVQTSVFVKNTLQPTHGKFEMQLLPTPLARYEIRLANTTEKEEICWCAGNALKLQSVFFNNTPDTTFGSATHDLLFT